MPLPPTYNFTPDGTLVNLRANSAAQAIKNIPTTPRPPLPPGPVAVSGTAASAGVSLSASTVAASAAALAAGLAIGEFVVNPILGITYPGGQTALQYFGITGGSGIGQQATQNIEVETQEEIPASFTGGQCPGYLYLMTATVNYKPLNFPATSADITTGSTNRVSGPVSGVEVRDSGDFWTVHAVGATERLMRFVSGAGDARFRKTSTEGKPSVSNIGVSPQTPECGNPPPTQEQQKQQVSIPSAPPYQSPFKPSAPPQPPPRPTEQPKAPPPAPTPNPIPPDIPADTPLNAPGHTNYPTPKPPGSPAGQDRATTPISDLKPGQTEEVRLQDGRTVTYKRNPDGSLTVTAPSTFTNPYTPTIPGTTPQAPTEGEADDENRNPLVFVPPVLPLGMPTNSPPGAQPINPPSTTGQGQQPPTPPRVGTDNPCGCNVPLLNQLGDIKGQLGNLLGAGGLGADAAILAALEQIKNAIGVSGLPASVPANLANPAGGQKSIGSLAELHLWQTEQLDGLVGQFPQKTTIQTPDGDRDIDVPNVSEALSEIIGMLVGLTVTSSQILHTGSRTLHQAGSATQQAHLASLYSKANAEFLGYEGRPNAIDMPLSYTPGANPFEGLLQEGTAKIKGWQNNDSQDMKAILAELLQSAAIIRAVYWRKLDPKSDFNRQMRDNIMAQNKFVEDENQRGAGSNDWEEYLRQVEQGFINRTGGSTPYGRNPTESPKIRDLSDPDNLPQS